MQADNVLVDMTGAWWLGDLGSAVATGEVVQSTTKWFSPETLIGQTAKPKHDWYMLAVMLAAELHKCNWKEKLMEDGHCPASKPMAASMELLEAKTQPLKHLLGEILQRAEVSAASGVWL